MNKTPITDAVATLTILAALIAGGYLWLVHESDKIIQHKQQPEQKHEKTVMERLAPKSFAVVVKRTE